MAIYLTQEEILDLTATAVKILRETDCGDHKALFDLAQNEVLEPHRRRDVSGMNRQQYEWLYDRALIQKVEVEETEGRWRREVAELTQKMGKSLKIQGLLESLVQELGLEKSDDAREWRDQIEGRLGAIEERLDTIEERLAEPPEIEHSPPETPILRQLVDRERYQLSNQSESPETRDGSL